MLEKLAIITKGGRENVDLRIFLLLEEKKTAVSSSVSMLCCYISLITWVLLSAPSIIVVGHLTLNMKRQKYPYVFLKIFLCT